MSDVAQIFTVDLEREWLLAADLDSIEVGPVEHPARAPAEHGGGREPRNRPHRYPARSNEVQSVFEARLRRDSERESPKVGVGVAIGDEGEGRAFSVDFERGLETPTMGHERARDGEREGPVRRPAIVLSAELVDAAHDLRGEADRRRKGEPPSVDVANGDAAGSPSPMRVPNLCGGGKGVTRDAERPGEHAGAAAGNHAQRHTRLEAVDHLVEDTVAAEDDDGLGIRLRGQIGRVSGSLRPDDVGAEDFRHLRSAIVRHRARVRIDDQDAARHRAGTMPRIDHVAVATDDPDRAAEFYERLFGARIVKEQGHPVMAYLGNTGFAFHELGGPEEHIGVRVSAEKQQELKRRLDEEGIAWEEHDHGVAVGVFFADPDGRQLEAIVYAGVE